MADHVERRGRVVRSRGPIIRGIIIGYLILAAGVTFSFYRQHHLFAEANRNLHEQQVQSDAAIAQAVIMSNKQLAQANLSNCQDVEKLKLRVRLSALRNYRDLAKNAKLLGITLTHDLRAKALHDRDLTLKRYAREECPRHETVAPQFNKPG